MSVAVASASAMRMRMEMVCAILGRSRMQRRSSLHGREASAAGLRWLLSARITADDDSGGEGEGGGEGGGVEVECESSTCWCCSRSSVSASLRCLSWSVACSSCCSRCSSDAFLAFDLEREVDAARRFCSCRTRLRSASSAAAEDERRLRLDEGTAAAAESAIDEADDEEGTRGRSAGEGGGEMEGALGMRAEDAGWDIASAAATIPCTEVMTDMRWRCGRRLVGRLRCVEGGEEGGATPTAEGAKRAQGRGGAEGGL